MNSPNYIKDRPSLVSCSGGNKTSPPATLINWNPALIIHAGCCDEQHKRLVGFINQLYEAFEAKTDNETLCAFFMSLTRIFEAHLDDDVNLLSANGCADLAAQKSEQEKSARQMCQDHRKQLQTGDSFKLSMLVSLSEGLISHIWRDGKLYATCLNAQKKQIPLRAHAPDLPCLPES